MSGNGCSRRRAALREVWQSESIAFTSMDALPLNCVQMRSPCLPCLAFLKQSYNLEDIRVRKYQRLKNLVVLVTAAAYFAATFLGHKMKLRILCEKLLIISQRFFGIPPFRFYALADGISRILAQTSPDPHLHPPQNPQMQLLLAWQYPIF